MNAEIKSSPEDTPQKKQKQSGMINMAWEKYNQAKNDPAISEGERKQFYNDLWRCAAEFPKNIVYKIIPNDFDIHDDCVAEAVFKIPEIIEKYENENDASFCTYFYGRVIGIMQDEYRKERRYTMLRSLTFERRLHDINHIRGKYGENLTPTEITEKIVEKITESDSNSHWEKAKTKEIHPPDTILKMVRAAINKSSRPLKLNHPISEDGPDLIETTSGDTSIYLQPDEALETEQDITILYSLITNLDERAQDIIRGKYFKKISLIDTGEKWGISESRACQIHTQSLKRLNDMYKKNKDGQGPLSNKFIEPRPPKNLSKYEEILEKLFKEVSHSGHDWDILVSQLPEKEPELIKGYFNGISLPEMAKVEGLTRSGMSVRRRKAVNNLKKLWEELKTQKPTRKTDSSNVFTPFTGKISMIQRRQIP